MKTSNNFVHNLTIHLIFVCKYRKKLLIKYGNEIKNLFLECANQNDTFDIQEIEVDQDHVHMMIDFYPTEAITNIVRKLKQYSVFHIWENHESELQHQFWKRKMFWSKSYFVCTIGDASREIIKKYIESQGQKPRNKHFDSYIRLKP